MAETVLDASAFLALFNDEPGADHVAAIAHRAQVSAVNLAEVVSKLMWKGWSVSTATVAVADLHCEIVEADEVGAVRAGVLHARLRGRGISLADSFCLSLAEANGLPVLTGDRAWTTLDLDVDVQLIR